MEAVVLRPDSASALLELLDERAETALEGLAGVAEGHSADPNRYVAELSHFLGLLHGETPSVLDIVAASAPQLSRRLEAACAQLSADRRWLAQLSVKTGHLVELSGLSESEFAVRNLRTAMMTLAQSQRQGCGLGVALGVLSDWPKLRAALDLAGTLAFSAGWPSPETGWPQGARHTLLDEVEGAFAALPTARAVSFGAGQWLQVHAQLLRLVDARCGHSVVSS
ncbi:hypothetical protein B5C34_10560 [Pacificimonas flava]|uniref:Uncharacterized protein n=2 Tax=Pacificimonas TaxID=1960290 RepID=A0A219B7U8_9SPHN|nr:hypothetical protein B5C34_10560 [Pacificimonas flava]